MTPDQVADLRRVLAYAMPDEKRDFDQQTEAGEPVTGHIYLSMLVLAAYAEGWERDRARGCHDRVPGHRHCRHGHASDCTDLSNCELID